MCDYYNCVDEDIDFMSLLGVDVYCFLIVWIRIIFLGGCDIFVNEKGIVFYNNFIDKLLVWGIEFVVMLYYWDVL